jgi:UDP-N-acetyl-D-galactosamine dehydrogenase
MHVTIVGCGYVGLSLAESLSGHHKVTGYDRNAKVIAELRGRPDTAGVATWTTSPDAIAESDAVVICVGTPLNDETGLPDHSIVEQATDTVAKLVRDGTLIVWESTYSPGETRKMRMRVLDEASASGLMFGYSPERVSPGPGALGLHEMVKVASGDGDPEVEAALIQLYGESVGQLHMVSRFEAAELAKLAENSQRDVLIAHANEMAVACAACGADVYEVLGAAATKWNYAHLLPGLVGGHCIPVDSHYLIEGLNAEDVDVPSEVATICAARETNDRAIDRTLELVMYAADIVHPDSGLRGARILVAGVAYKPELADTRESPGLRLAASFARRNAIVDVWDDVAGVRIGIDGDPHQTRDRWSVVVLACAHRHLVESPALWKGLVARGSIVDPSGALRERPPAGVRVLRLDTDIRPLPF